MPATRTEQITTDDGELAAHIAIPDGGGGPGIVLIQEIFGVNDYIRDSAERLADIGHVVLAPDLYWRTEPGLEIAHDEEGIQKGMAAARKLDGANAVADVLTSLAALRLMPEVNGGKAGVMGFCLGGSLAFQAAIHGDPDAAVVYYGSLIPNAIGDADKIVCPMIMHWGGADPYIPREGIDAVTAMAAEHDRIECHVHEGAGHAFDNHLAPMFHQPEPRAAAWELTTAFLARHLPV